MAEDYKMIAGMVGFIVVVLAIIGSASVEYPEIAGAATAPVGGQWPPSFPVFGSFTPDLGEFPGCEPAVFCMNTVVYLFVVWIFFIFDIAIFIASVVSFVVQLFAGLAAFSLSGLPTEFVWVGLGFAIIFIIIFSLIFVRFLVEAIGAVVP